MRRRRAAFNLATGPLTLDAPRRRTATLKAHVTAQEATVITLTDNAAVKVKDLIAQEGDDKLMLRVAVRPGGCSGFSYEMFFDSELETDDLTLDYSGVKVVVDPSSAQLLTGATLDYKDGLTDAGFAINNPNAQKTCGCGQSFS